MTTEDENVKEIHQLHDKVLKYLFNIFGQDFLNGLNINYTFKKAISTELIVLGVKSFYLDVLIETEEGILLDIEFQSTKLYEKPLIRFYLYALFATIKYREEIETYIVSKEEKKTYTRTLKLNEKFKYPFKVISLKEVNGEELLDKLENKIKNNQEIGNDEIVQLILVGYSSFNQTIETIFKRAVKILEKIETLNKEVKANIKYIMELLYRRLSGKELEGELKEVFRMGPTLYEEALIEGKKNVAKRMLKNGLSIDDIHTYTALSKNEILELEKTI